MPFLSLFSFHWFSLSSLLTAFSHFRHYIFDFFDEY
jgi:hypothetical protein